MRRWLKVTLFVAVLGIPAAAYAGTQLLNSDCPCTSCPFG
jgi:hypothetical protein